MSNLVFPSISPGAGWSWKWPIKKTPKFTTLVQTPASQRGEVRIAIQTFPIWFFSYDISYLKGNPQTSASFFAQIIGFYGQVQGAADDFLFQDIYDYQVTAQEIGVGDGLTTYFQMYRTIGGMVDLVQNFISAPSLYLSSGGSTVLQTSGYSIDQYGNLTFATAPGVGVVITWTGDFYYRVRFIEDQQDNLRQRWLNTWDAAEFLKMKSVLL